MIMMIIVVVTSYHCLNFCMSSLLACVKTSTLVAGTISALKSVHRNEDSAGPEAPEALATLAVAAVASENRGVNQVGPAPPKGGWNPMNNGMFATYINWSIFFINSTLSTW